MVDGRRGRNSLLIALLLFSLMLGWSGYQQPQTREQTLAATVNPLPVVGSKEKLIELLKAANSYNPQVMYLRKEIMPAAADQAQVAVPSEGSVGSLNNKAKSDDYSSTNIQVAGVDEADIIKTDGQYIYQVNKNRILIINTQNPGKMQVVAKLTFSDDSFIPQELYIDENKLVVIGQNTLNVPGPCYSSESNPQKCPPLYYNRQSTRALIYDMQDKTQLKQTRELEIEGGYLSSRRIGHTLYLVTNENIFYANDTDIILPYYRDSSAGAKPISLGYNQLRYFPNHVYPAFINIAAVDTANTGQAAQVQSYLGNGENIYASGSNLYIAASSYQAPEARPLLKDSSVSSSASASAPVTTLYKFALNTAGISYAGKGEVPGNILNQFSMDEDQGYFRIATTTGNVWDNGANISKNNIYILDTDMKLVGKLEGIAPGEKIYSTRFLGNRAYMVTFKKVDPFFVIDLKNPAQPAVLGKLKIPGYSDYLHPYDETHIIGFGKDTIEAKSNDGTNPMAFYQGLKVALFDVSDVNHPQEISKVIIGDRGTDSELLSNHKALLFSRDKNLLAFPITVMKIRENDKQQAASWPAYGSFEFQGAYFYQIDLNKGLQYKGRITHLTKEEILQAGDSWYNSEKNIERIIYINNILYTLSTDQIQAHAWPNLKTQGQLKLP